MSKNGSDFRIGSNLCDCELKTDCFKRGFVYTEPTVTTKQKSPRHIQCTRNREKGIQTHTTERHQRTREESKTPMSLSSNVSFPPSGS